MALIAVNINLFLTCQIWQVWKKRKFYGKLVKMSKKPD